VFDDIVNIGQCFSRLCEFGIYFQRTVETPPSFGIALEAEKNEAQVKESLFAASLLTVSRASEHDHGLLQTSRPLENSSEKDAIAGIRRTQLDGSAIPGFDHSNRTLPFVKLPKVVVYQRPICSREKASSPAQCRSGLNVARHLRKCSSAVKPCNGVFGMFCDMALREQCSRGDHVSRIESRNFSPSGFTLISCHNGLEMV
jgi:hypothetical protein